jgi:acyl carrier protein
VARSDFRSAEPIFKKSGEPGVYQWTRKLACAALFLHLCALSWQPTIPAKFQRKKRVAVMSVRLKIFAVMKQVADEQQVRLPQLDDNLSLHETGFDSLAFAILVARLEDDLGINPFTISEDAAFPLTVGDFVRSYENVSV